MKKFPPSILVHRSSNIITKEYTDNLLMSFCMDDWYQYTEDGRKLIDGELVFKLMDTHGIPLDMMIDILGDSSVSIKWLEFILSAYEHNWHSYQIHEKIKHSLEESINFSRPKERIEEIMCSVRIIICLNGKEYRHCLCGDVSQLKDYTGLNTIGL